MGLDRIGSPPGRTVFAAVTRRWPRGPAGPYCPAARRRSSSRWRAIAGSRYECIDLGLSPGDLWGFRQPAVSAGQGEGDCLAVLPLARSPARASALARTTSGSRGSGGRTSCQGRSRRTFGRWIRIRCTVSHLPGQPPIPGGRWRTARPWWPGSSRNGTDSRLGGASPEGACQVEYRGAASGHPKVLPDRLGCGVRGPGPAAGPARRPRSGWRQRACQDVGHGHFDCVKRHHQVVGDVLVGPAGGRHLRVTPHPGERFSSSTSIASDSKPAVSACRPDHRGCR
jgi:hypothetical protein